MENNENNNLIFKSNLLNDKIVLTTALPYANGDLHLGHFLEYIQADVFSRTLKNFNKNVFFVCASDMHGTPIEINALKNNVSPEEFSESFRKKHIDVLKKYNISFDEFYSTHSEENKKLAEYFFEKLKEKNLIYSKEVEQLYCEYDKRFLPDRFVKGTCPFCGAKDQYGDVCEVCGKTYKADELVDPYCILCKNKPVKKHSKHYFFKLSSLSDELKDYILNSDLQEETKNYVLNWINSGLKDWDISRDGPYFGFKIPGEDNKYFYVWLDAPIGYISSLQHLLNLSLEDVKSFWNDSFIIHIIGKDIMYFHLLFWPAMLKNVGFKAPDKIHVHGFLNVDGEKMSKSRGTFITAESLLEKYPSDIVRFYISSLLNDKIDDVNFSEKDLINKVNHELISNIMNFHYRTLSLLKKRLDNSNINFNDLFNNLSDEDKKIFSNLLKEMFDFNFKFFNYISNFKHNLAVKTFLQSGDLVNKFIQSRMPWKEEDNTFTLSVSYFLGLLNLNMLKVLMPSTFDVLLKQYSFDNNFFEDFNVFLKNNNFDFDNIVNSFLKHKNVLNVVYPEIVYKKFKEEENIKNNSDKSKSKEGKNNSNKSEENKSKKNNENDNEKNDKNNRSPSSSFSNVLLKSALIVDVKKHPNADKLYILKLKVPYDELDEEYEKCKEENNYDTCFEERTIVSGLVDYFSIDELLNKKIVLVYNLKPAVLRKVKSEGMLLAAEFNDKLSLLEPEGFGYIFAENFNLDRKKVKILKENLCSIDDVLNSNLIVKDKKVKSPFGFLKTKNGFVKVNIDDNASIH